MSTRRTLMFLFLFLQMLLLWGCATLQGRDPIDVTLAGVEPLEGGGLELRMLARLRIQNPNDFPLEFSGISIRMDVQGRPFATGVSDMAGSVPRFGETMVGVPVSVSVFRIARQAMDVITTERRGMLPYEITGRLGGNAFRGMRFKSRGEFKFPSEFLEGGR